MNTGGDSHTGVAGSDLNRLFVAGTSHRSSPAALREQLHEPAAASLAARLRSRQGRLREVVVLATCSRFEIYGVCEHPLRSHRAFLSIAARRFGISRRELENCSYFHRGESAAHHLFRVAAGLDSAVTGEAQILGQVRAAIAQVSADHAGTLLRRLFDCAIASGRRARRETGIGRGTTSLAGAAVDLLRRNGGLAGRRALVIGAGKTGALTARLLRKHGVADLVIANRTLQNAERVASEVAGSAISLRDVSRVLAESDIVFGAVTATEPVLHAWQVMQSTTPNGRNRVFVDLGHPRCFDPAIGSLPNAELLDLGGVHQRIAQTRSNQVAQRSRAESMVAQEVASFIRWVQSRQALPVVLALRQQVLELAQREAERFGRGLDPAGREQLERFARALARSFLHAPTAALQKVDPSNGEGSALVRNAEQLFDLDAAAVSIRPGVRARADVPPGGTRRMTGRNA